MSIYDRLSLKCRNWDRPYPIRGDLDGLEKIYDLICFLEGRIWELERSLETRP